MGVTLLSHGVLAKLSPLSRTPQNHRKIATPTTTRIYASDVNSCACYDTWISMGKNSLKGVEIRRRKVQSLKDSKNYRRQQHKTGNVIGDIKLESVSNHLHGPTKSLLNWPSRQSVRFALLHHPLWRCEPCLGLIQSGVTFARWGIDPVSIEGTNRTLVYSIMRNTLTWLFIFNSNSIRSVIRFLTMFAKYTWQRIMST